jgi:hypothetical protein
VDVVGEVLGTDEAFKAVCDQVFVEVHV